MPTKTIRPRWGMPGGDTGSPHYLTDDDIAWLAQRYAIASPTRLAKELHRATRAIWMYKLSRTAASPAEQRAALRELAHSAEWLSDRLRRGVLDPEARRRLRAAYAGLDPDRPNATGPLLSDQKILAMRLQARNLLQSDIGAVARLAKNLAVAAGKIEVASGSPGEPAQRFAEDKLGAAFEAAAGRRRGRKKFVADVVRLWQSAEIRKELPTAEG